jgi:hypothetical protein
MSGTLSALDEQLQLALGLAGMACSQVSLASESALVLDFGELRLSKHGELSGSSWLVVDCPWRIDSQDTVLCGWDDEEDEAVEDASALVGSSVAEVAFRRPGYDLLLRFDNGCVLLAFPDCRAYFTEEMELPNLPWHVGASER